MNDPDIDPTRTDTSDPVGRFAARLMRLRAASGQPSVRELEQLTGKLGMPHARSTIDDKLHGRSAPQWEFVESFVRACALHSGHAGPIDLRQWRQWHGQLLRDLGRRRAGQRQVVIDQTCPYRGLEPFTAEHAQWFHGRALAVDRVLAGLGSHPRAMLLLGPSGAGKSSLLQAGVMPALAEGALPGSDQWIRIVLRAGRTIAAGLDRCGLPGLGQDGRSLATVVTQRLATAGSGGRILLALDQFEELLTPCVGDEGDLDQQVFLDDLAAAIGTAGLTVVAVLRDDFYPRLAALAPALLEAMAPGVVNVPATLAVAELRDIIIRPAESAGLRWQDQLPERIIGDLLTAGRDSRSRQVPVTLLPLLELALEQLWLRRRDGLLTHEAYQRLGGVSGAVTSWCDAAVTELPADRRLVAQRILTALVRPVDDLHRIPAVRQQVAVGALCELAAPSDPPFEVADGATVASQVLQTLVQRRIVTVGITGTRPETGEVPVAELVHDAVIRDWATLREWVDQDHRFQDWLHRVRKQHHRWTDRRDDAELLYGSVLTDGLEWAAQRRLPAEIAQFVAASHRHQQAAIRRSRRLNAILASLLALTVLATGAATWQRRDAVIAQRQALSRQLSAQSAALIDSDPDLAALLAAHAYRTSPTTQALTSLSAAASEPLRRVLDDPDRSVDRLTLSSDGRAAATRSGSGDRVRLWDLGTGTVRSTVEGSAFAFTPDGRRLVDVHDTTLRVIEVASGRVSELSTECADASAMAVGPDGSFAVVQAMRDVRVCDLATGRLRTVVQPSPNLTGSALAFSPDGRTLAVTNPDHTIQLWDVAERRLLSSLAGHAGWLWQVAFSADGTALASVSSDATLRLWNVADGRLRTTIPSGSADFRAVAFGADGRAVVTADAANTVRQWDASDGRLLDTLTVHGGSMNVAALRQDGRSAAVADPDGHIRVLDVLDRRLRSAMTSDDRVHAVAFDPDGRTLATGGTDQVVRLWALPAGQPRAQLKAHTSTIRVVAFTSDGTGLISVGQRDEARRWDLATGQGRSLVTEYAKQVEGRQEGPTVENVYGIGLSRDGKVLAAGSYFARVRLWNVETGTLRSTLTTDVGAAWAVAFSPDGRLLATGDDQHVVRLWDAASGRQRKRLPAGTGTLHALAFSPDGRTLASGGDDSAVRLWDAASGRLLATLAGARGGVWAVAFSPDGRTLASGGDDSAVRLWDAASGRLLATLKGHTAMVNALAFSPDGRGLASGSDDHTARLWEVAPLDPDRVVRQICTAVGRDLAPRERRLYLPSSRRSATVCRS